MTGTHAEHDQHNLEATFFRAVERFAKQQGSGPEIRRARAKAHALPNQMPDVLALHLDQLLNPPIRQVEQ